MRNVKEVLHAWVRNLLYVSPYSYAIKSFNGGTISQVLEGTWDEFVSLQFNFIRTNNTKINCSSSKARNVGEMEASIWSGRPRFVCSLLELYY